MIKRLLIFLSLIMLWAITCTAQSIDESTDNKISNLLVNLKKAHLESDTKLAFKIYDEEMILTSQSGKRYTKKEALLNIKNKFGFYENSDIIFLSINKNVVITNFINERQIANFPRAKYRITAVWVKRKDGWKIISLQSSKMRVKPK